MVVLPQPLIPETTVMPFRLISALLMALKSFILSSAKFLYFAMMVFVFPDSASPEGFGAIGY